ncbi:MAG: hypothetical protein MHM6MM_008832 [Cercozoa sp. M6MM]
MALGHIGMWSRGSLLTALQKQPSPVVQLACELHKTLTTLIKFLFVAFVTLAAAVHAAQNVSGGTQFGPTRAEPANYDAQAKASAKRLAELREKARLAYFELFKAQQAYTRSKHTPEAVRYAWQQKKAPHSHRPMPSARNTHPKKHMRQPKQHSRFN